jgi:hypothetical protein
MIRRETGSWTFRLLSKTALSAGALSALFACASAQAQDRVLAFYSGRTISITIAYPPGGSYDIYSRLAAAHMAKYIPGRPNFIVQNSRAALVFCDPFTRLRPRMARRLAFFPKRSPSFN